MNWIAVISKVSVFSTLLPVIAGIRKTGNILWIYACVRLITELTVSYVVKGHDDAKFVVANTFVFVEFLLISLYIRKKLFPKRSMLFGLFIFLVIVGFAIQTFIVSIFYFNTIATTVFNFIGIIYAILGLHYLITKTFWPRLEESEFFWACVAILIYFAGKFMVILFKDHLIETNPEDFITIWRVLHNSVNIAMNLILAVALSRKEP